MTVNTHCLPSGSLGTNELPVPQVSVCCMDRLTPSGSKRGVVVMLHQMNIGIINPFPMTMAGNTLSLANALVTDGWIVMQPCYAEDRAGNVAPNVAIQNDLSADGGHGSRYLTQALHWWDHVVAWINATYGNWPIVPFGISWGGWYALQIASNKASTITAYGLHVPVTVLSDLTLDGFGSFNTTGLDTTTNMLNSVTKPGILGWSTNDIVVGHTNIQNIYNAASGAGKPVTSNATTDGHALGSGSVTTYTNWFTNTVDPLAPATH